MVVEDPTSPLQENRESSMEETFIGVGFVENWEWRCREMEEILSFYKEDRKWVSGGEEEEYGDRG